MSDGSSSGKSSYCGTTASRRMRSMVPSDMSICNRPVTGAGGGLARQRGAGPMPRFESVGYYSNLVQEKTESIIREIERLQFETEMADGGSEARRKLDNDYKLLVRDIQQLEASLADLNLAKDKARSGSDREDIHDQTIDILNRNEKLEHEIDEIFVSRKRIDSEVLKYKADVKSMTDAMKESLSSDPDMLLRYQELLGEIDTIHDEAKTEENKMTELRAKIKLVSKCGVAKMHIEELERRIEEVDLDIELAVIDENEGRIVLLEKVKQMQQNIKKLDKQGGGVQTEIDALIKEQSELKQIQRLNSYYPEENVVKQLKQKCDEQKRFLANVPELKAQLEEENKRLTAVIAALEKDVGRRSAATEFNFPSKAELELMHDEVTFTTKHLDNNQDTINRLQQQKKTRMMELKRINTLEDKIAIELREIESKRGAMKLEMDSFKTREELQASADMTRESLLGQAEQYIQKIQEMDGLLSKVSSKYEEKKKTLMSNPNWERYEVLRTKLQDQEKVINELQEQITQMKAKSDYSNLKAKCLSLAHNINDAIICDKQ